MRSSRGIINHVSQLTAGDNVGVTGIVSGRERHFWSNA